MGLLMKFSENAHLRSGRAWTAWLLAALVLITGGLGTWVAAQYFLQTERDNLQQALQERTRASQGRATGFLALTGDSLRALSGMLNAGESEQSPIFARYAQQLLRQQPEIMAVGFVLNPASLTPIAASPMEPTADPAASDPTDPAAVSAPVVLASAALRPTGDAPLTVVVTNAQGPGAALGDGSQLLGTDLHTLPALKGALARSQVASTLEYSGLLEGQWTYMTPIGDEGALRGHLIAFLAPNILLQNAVVGAADDGLARQLIDPTGTSGGPRLLYEEANGEALDAQLSAALTTQSDVSAFGQRWTLKLTALNGFVQSRSSPLPSYVLYGGALLTLVLAAFVFMVTARSARVQQLINRRTAELSEAYQRLRDSEMMAMQSEKMSSLGQMVAGVAHEINTPLGFISSNVQLLRELLGRLRPLMDNQHKLLSAVPHWTRLAPEQKQLWFKAALQQGAALQQIRQEGLSDDLDSLTSESLSGLERLTDLVLTLKNFSRLDRSMIDDVDLNTCIEDTLKISHNVVKQKADVIKDLQPLPKTRCNPSQINQVLLNLITNAAHAIDRYGTIELLSRLEGNEIRISVRDNGRGMSSDVLSRIFEPFFTTKGHGEGTGLGLAISQKIIEEHGGRLDVQSEPGVGTKFTVTLPVAR
jgi:signal transduction histidine kinase